MARADLLFTALQDPIRRGILEALKDGGNSAGQIAARFPVSWPAISRHLRILKRAGLVWETKEGRIRYYEINPPGLAPALNWLVQFRPTSPPPSPVPVSPTIGREYTS